MLGFETLTLVPIDRRLVVADMLAADELAWLNAYHARVREVIGPELGAGGSGLAGGGHGADRAVRLERKRPVGSWAAENLRSTLALTTIYLCRAK